MTRVFSRKPAKTKVYRVNFLGPKGGSHHWKFVFKLNQTITLKSHLTNDRGKAIMQKMKNDGWIVHVVEWHNSAVKSGPTGDPEGYLLYRIHRNDVYNSRFVKPGWRIVGEY